MNFLIKNATGSYSQTLYVFAGFFVIAFVVSIAMIINIKSVQKKKVKH
jgi:OFA family oxalate/formate antiporter-like MFS transporter